MAEQFFDILVFDNLVFGNLKSAACRQQAGCFILGRCNKTFFKASLSVLVSSPTVAVPSMTGVQR